MFFFIAGIQPKTVTLDDHARKCPSCGLYQAYLKKVNHYVSIFFIPVFRVRSGVPFLECRSCGRQFDEYSSTIPSGLGPVSEKRGRSACPYCGRAVEPGFRFCPYCGKTV